MKKRYIDDFLRDCAPGGRLLSEGLSAAPLCSVNLGGAGIAFVLYKLSRNTGDMGLLSLADTWIQLTTGSLDEPEAFWNEELDLTEATLGNNSLLHSEVGVRCVEALIARAMGNGPGHRQAVDDFLRAGRVLGKMNEFALGKGGVLVGCGLLMSGLAASDGKLREKLRARGEQIYRDIASQTLGQDRITGEGAKRYLGMAHGTAGVLYSLLQWHEISGTEVSPELAIALQKLARLGKTVESGVRWPLEKGKRTYWPGWCHGSAGYVFLWTLAAKLLARPDYLTLARAAGEYAWQSRNPVLCLCCGAAGQAYAFLNLYRAKGASIWLKRARENATVAMEINGDSLFRGRAGAVALLSDLDRPETSAMPMFEAAP